MAGHIPHHTTCPGHGMTRSHSAPSTPYQWQPFFYRLKPNTSISSPLSLRNPISANAHSSSKAAHPGQAWVMGPGYSIRVPSRAQADKDCPASKHHRTGVVQDRVKTLKNELEAYSHSRKCPPPSSATSAGIRSLACSPHLWRAPRTLPLHVPGIHPVKSCMAPRKLSPVQKYFFKVKALTGTLVRSPNPRRRRIKVRGLLAPSPAAQRELPNPEGIRGRRASSQPTENPSHCQAESYDTGTGT